MADTIGYGDIYGSNNGEPGPSSMQNVKQDGPKHDFSTSLSSWREIRLPELQQNLEALRPTLVDGQKEALISRKKLAEQTREFKKQNPEAQPELVKPLLKAYQSEIDNLTRRAKTAENAVLGVRDRLQNASDPYPLLEVVLEQMAVVGDLESLKGELEKVQKANTSLESQVTALRSVEAEKNKISERLASLESSTEKRIADARKAIDAELSAKWDERIMNHTTREESLSKSLETTQAQLKELRANYAKATEKLLSRGEDVEREQANGNIEEMDVIGEELTRSNERVATVERRNEQLRQEIERLKSGVGEDSKLQALKERIAEGDEENRRLAELLDEESKRARKEVEDQKKRTTDIEIQLREKNAEIASLRNRIQNMADYDEVKRELEIFKYVEFAADREADEEGERETNATLSAKPLETLLVEKNRWLQDELASFRVSHSELSTECQAKEKQLETLHSEVSKLKKLNERLEDDLIHLKPGSSTHNKSSMSAEEALAEIEKLGQEASRSEKDPRTPQSSSPPRKATDAPIPFDPQPPSSASGASTSILPIITSQRDRFRARNAELEEELRKQFATITELRTEVKTLQNDNLALYEKVRYLQAYHATSSQSSAYRGPGGGSQIASVSARNDTTYPPSTRLGEDKYREKYEASMNPFEQFRGREQSRALHALNPLERLLHLVTRVVLGHRRMRIFFVVYAVCLHILVFAMLFEVEFASS